MPRSGVWSPKPRAFQGQGRGRAQRAIALAAFENELNDLARGPAFLDLLEGPVSHCEIGALQHLCAKHALAPAVNMPVAPKLLTAPWQVERNRYWRASVVAARQLVNLSPPGRCVVRQPADEIKPDVWAFRQQAGERLVQR